MNQSKRTQETIELDIFIGKQLERARIKHGLTQKAVGLYMSVSASQIYNYETGSSHIPVIKLLALTSFLQVRLSYFFPPILSKINIHKPFGEPCT